jgi:beta-lactamase regulating signal transducer with metallopeptidase domain
MILYFLKTIIVLGIFALLFGLLLKPYKSFKWNRRYLVITSLLALILPLIHGEGAVISASTITPQLYYTLETIKLFESQVQDTELDYGKIIFGLYLVGLLWGLARITLGYWILHRIKLNATLQNVHGSLIYASHDIETPFSFRTNIYIPASFLDKPILPTVIMHEQMHINLHHSRDKIYFSFLQAILWLNPFIYLYHKESERVHEFEVDEKVSVQTSTDVYVENLLRANLPQQVPTLLVHQFFHHPLKTRITMLYSKSKNMFMQKASIILSALFVCLCLLCLQSFGYKKEKHKMLTAKPIIPVTVTVKRDNGEIVTMIIHKDIIDSVYETADMTPEFDMGKTSITDFVIKNLAYPDNAKRGKIQERVIIEFVVDKNADTQEIEVIKGIDENLSLAAKQLVKKFPRWKPAMLDGKPVNMKMALPIEFKL